tara:strand:+ start:406 stop:1134 length:729 start_codon:yes stop_codon:yes gene_type:complete
MGYFNELPNIAYQSPLSHKNSSRDYIIIKNLFRRTKLFDHLSGSVSALDRFVIENGERPDTVAELLYGDSRLDYIVILVAGITNINHQWPLEDHQVYNYALDKYGSDEKLNGIHHYETFEIRDEQDRQILPPNLIVDVDFKIDGTAVKYPSTIRYTIISETGNRQLDDKNEFTVLTDNIASPVTNLEYEYIENEKRREINVLYPSYVQAFINDLREVVRYDKSSNYITSSLASTENTEVVNP